MTPNINLKSMRMRPKPLGLNSLHTAFTLSELLVSLAILGLIASMVMPKVIYGIDQAQNKAKLKETIAIIEALASDAYLEGAYSTKRWDYFINRTKLIKICSSNGVTEGCLGNGTTFEDEQSAFVLQNGVTVGGINSFRGDDEFNKLDGWVIDVNGVVGPNEFGKDVIYIIAPSFYADGTKTTYCSERRLTCPVGGTEQMYRELFE
jgi:prepilin-type N-terminal cleavage/methylation domain-containing protein